MTGYLLTRPFEQQCPMPAVFVKDNSYLDGMLKPVLRPVGDAGAAAEQAAPAARKQGVTGTSPVPAAADGKSEGGKGKKEKKETAPKAAAAAAGDADPKLEAFGKAQLQVGQVRMDATEDADSCPGTVDALTTPDSPPGLSLLTALGEAKAEGHTQAHTMTACAFLQRGDPVLPALAERRR